MSDTSSNGEVLAVLYNDRGSKLIESGDFEGAKACFQEALRHSPENPGILCNLGFVYFNLKQFVAAEKVCREALDSDPTSFIAARYFAVALVAQEKQAECIRFCLEMLDVFPDDHDLLAHILKPLFTTGNFEEVIARKDTTPHQRFVVGWAHDALGRHENALEVFQDIVESSPEETQIFISLIHSITRFGKARNIYAAYQVFERIVGSSKYRVWAHYQLARYYPCGDTMGIFERKPEIPLDLPPGTHNPTTIGMSQQVRTAVTN